MLVMEAVEQARGTFTIADLQRGCPAVGVDMIRHVLKKLQRAAKVACVQRGRNALWKKLPG